MNDLTKTESLALDTSSMPPALAAMFDDRVFNRMTHVAETLSKAQGFCPPHLIGKVHACFAVVTRSLTWRLDPFAVAQATYEVGGRIAYEGKLVQAILESSGQIEGNIKFELTGDWSKVQGKFKKITREKNGRKTEFAVPDWQDADEEGLGVIVSAKVRGEAEPRELPFALREAFPRNSVLWATRPSQQIKYTAVRAFASTVAPSLFMGVPFDTDQSAGMRDITGLGETIDNDTGEITAAGPIDWVASGREAYAQGVSFRAAPGHLAANDYDDWCRGWQAASKEEHGEDSNVEDAPEQDAQDSSASTADDGPSDDATTRKEVAADEPAEIAGPRSLNEMLAEAGKDLPLISRLKFAHKEASEGEEAFDAWLKEQMPENIKMLEPFGADLRKIAKLADLDK